MILIKNIYYMLAYAFQALHQDGYKQLSSEKFDNIHNLLAAILSKGLANQIKHGLGKEYIEISEEMYSPHGKITFFETMRTFPNNKKVVCEYDEFSENSYFNRILKTTASMMIRCKDVGASTKKALKKSLLFLGSVDLISLHDIQWNRFSFDRNNASYKLLLNICYLYLNGMLASEKGVTKYRSFLDEQKMHKLFQNFILEYYRKHFPFLKPKASKIDWNSDNKVIDYLPQMKSDVTLSYDDFVLIIDTKFYKKSMQTYFDKQTVISGNLYQIFTYVKNKDISNSGKVSGMLLYAKTDEKITPDFEYMLSGNSIKVKTLDLNRDFSEIASKLDDIAYEWCPNAKGNRQIQ